VERSREGAARLPRPWNRGGNQIAFRLGF
jgi:hypothetical protein